MIIAKFAAVIVIGYILGSIPSGVIVCRLLTGVDVRQYGSGKMGMTNVMRMAGKKAAVAVFLLDLLKGALAVIFAGLIIGTDYLMLGSIFMGALAAQVLAALAAVAGHIYPVFVKFRGGRGVLAFFGGLAAIYPLAALIGGVAFVMGMSLSRYVSLGSIVGTVVTYILLVPLTILNGFPIEYLIYTLAGAVIVFVMHRDNIARLVVGKERRLGEKAERISL